MPSRLQTCIYSDRVDFHFSSCRAGRDTASDSGAAKRVLARSNAYYFADLLSKSS
ncbi:hypothetical protein HMPREF3208_01355 [Gardnerella vaginalis]|uniref:Uncharacterized protein n=1 Tax=Gardnerella vaginalis TaxID=2702 RepID=A0A133NR23_GARVA|nr:hypothetical protein HMPREF3208_01355 [Gardnerella vaginalis]